MNLSDAGANLIKSFEGCKLAVYKDIVGILTGGYGHIEASLKLGYPITQQQADDWFKQDVAKFESAVNRLAPNATQNQFDAMVSFSYNLGPRSLETSTLLKKFLAGDIQGAAECFLSWDMAGGKHVSGLARRRQAERSIFLGEM